MTYELAILTVIPVTVNVVALIIRGQTRLVYWSVAVIISMVLPLVVGAVAGNLSGARWQEGFSNASLFVFPVIASFAVMLRISWPWIGVLVLGPLTFLAALFLWVVVGVNAGLLHP